MVEFLGHTLSTLWLTRIFEAEAFLNRLLVLVAYSLKLKLDCDRDREYIYLPYPRYIACQRRM